MTTKSNVRLRKRVQELELQLAKLTEQVNKAAHLNAYIREIFAPGQPGEAYFEVAMDCNALPGCKGLGPHLHQWQIGDKPS